LPVILTKQEWRVKEKANTSAPTTSDDDMDLLDDDEALLMKDESPPPTSMDANMVFTLPAEFKGAVEEVAQMSLGPKEALFEKPEESSRHLKPLYVQGHIDGKPISRMLVDGGAAINLMPYSVFKRLGRKNKKLMKTNLMLNGVGGNLIEAWGVVSMELTVGSKSLATTFFIIEVQGNYSVILDYDCIHANHCIPSTLHQFLIQWINDEIDVVHADTLAYIALDAMVDWQHGSTQCPSGKDLTSYDFLSISKEEFVPVSIKLAFEAQLGNVVFQ
jgi:hypothetical protein